MLSVNASVLVIFLIAVTENTKSGVTGERLFSSQFLEVSFHNGLAPRQDDFTQNSLQQAEDNKATREFNSVLCPFYLMQTAKIRVVPNNQWSNLSHTLNLSITHSNQSTFEKVPPMTT